MQLEILNRSFLPSSRSGGPCTAGVLGRASAKSPDEQASSIESKRNLLAYLRSGPRHMTIESYLCLARILSRAGWRHDPQGWSKGGQQISTVDAAILELEQQIASDRDLLLRQTVESYANRLGHGRINNISSPK